MGVGILKHHGIEHRWAEWIAGCWTSMGEEWMAVGIQSRPRATGFMGVEQDRLAALGNDVSKRFVGAGWAAKMELEQCVELLLDFE